MNYFFDTYALIEFLEGNENYHKAFREGLITTRLNLMELYYQALKKWGKSDANKIYVKFLEHIVDFNDEIIKEAMEFRFEMRKGGKDFSYVDAIGYIVSKKNKVKFITGDKEFRGLPNVKFVK